MSTEEGIRHITEYPEINFIDSATMLKLQEDMVRWFCEKRKELTGRAIKLGEADDRRIILQAGSYYIFQAMMYVDNAGKMGLLKYATGDYLENLGALKGISRLQPRGATVTLRWSITEARETAVSIPKESSATAGDGVFFATRDYAEILPGELYVDVEADCSETGRETNGYLVGDINKMEVAVPYVDAVQNVTVSQNGRDLETDDDLRERIYMAPESYSCAGSKGAYEFFVRNYDSSVEDVRITSPAEREVEIRVILKDGELPDEEYIKGLTAYLYRDDIKMLTDKVTVKAPEVVDYKLDLTYYVNESDRSRAQLIRSKVEAAIDSYIMWQKTHIGRDIVPDELVRVIKNAGAKRVEIREPAFKIIDDNSVPNLQSKTVNYGGLEND